MKALRFIAMLLIVIGALNWGLVGFFQYNLVADLFGGTTSTAARVIFGLVGLAGLYGVLMLLKCCCGCKCGPNCSCCNKSNGSCNTHHHHQ